ncbi:hemicentin-2-like [Anopheles ziemanni]|uniref:hemicentin-2-like n=1 Tax=Anopheles coustani TaxID=139045 RepID=UPI002658E322|nr:hemicentin-2-like [Anopheles coustani]XP_058177001.1 hemicentin-2-like [Anopheles ziemanni]
MENTRDETTHSYAGSEGSASAASSLRAKQTIIDRELELARKRLALEREAFEIEISQRELEFEEHVLALEKRMAQQGPSKLQTALGVQHPLHYIAPGARPADFAMAPSDPLSHYIAPGTRPSDFAMAPSDPSSHHTAPGTRPSEIAMTPNDPSSHYITPGTRPADFAMPPSDPLSHFTVTGARPAEAAMAPSRPSSIHPAPGERLAVGQGTAGVMAASANWRHSVAPIPTRHDTMAAPAAENGGPSSTLRESPHFTHELNTTQKIPDDSPSFSGDTTQGPMLQPNFETSTEVCGFSGVENTFRLQKARNGPAYEAVEQFLFHPEGLSEAMNALREEFQHLETVTILSVNYYPRVGIGPENPLSVERDQTAKLECNIDAKPKPEQVECTRNGRFISSHPTHTIHQVSLLDAGRYTCSADNGLGKEEIPVNVFYQSIVQIEAKVKSAEKETVQIKCNVAANSPLVTIEWLKEDDTLVLRDVRAEVTGMYVCRGINMMKPYEGKYFCYASNELGNGGMASATLEIHQPPQFLVELSYMIKKAGEVDFFVTCGAKGKPEPLIAWLNDDVEITPELRRYEVKTNRERGANGMVTVHGTLMFTGKARPKENGLISTDRGQYTCLYENAVNKANSMMHLKIEHARIVLHHIKETAEIPCKVQSYPKPEFMWQFGTSLLNNGGHYKIVTNSDGNDVYTSILKISNVRHQDYGEYHCRVANTLNNIQVPIRLQPRVPPEKRTKLRPVELGSNFVTLAWNPGFDGGLANTKYLCRIAR